MEESEVQRPSRLQQDGFQLPPFCYCTPSHNILISFCFTTTQVSNKPAHETDAVLTGEHRSKRSVYSSLQARTRLFNYAGGAAFSVLAGSVFAISPFVCFQSANCQLHDRDWISEPAPAIACNTAVDGKNNLLPPAVVGSRSPEIAKFYLLSWNLTARSSFRLENLFDYWSNGHNNNNNKIYTLQSVQFCREDTQQQSVQLNTRRSREERVGISEELVGHLHI